MRSECSARPWLKMLVGLCFLAASARHVQAIYDDSGLAPSGLESVCEMPNLPVFDVTSYGATGNGTTDDTVAIRNAIAAAVASNGGIIYFPAGTYAVCHQTGDADPFVTPQIFNITNSSLVFLGEGADKSHISGYMPGLQSPITHWNDNPDTNAYSKISRFSMFFLSPSSAPITNVQFRSLEITGNAGYTGNFTVGGVQSTGDGWDMTHKCIGLVGSQPSDVLIFNCSLNKWRGEIVYGGGNQGTAYIINSHIFSSDASALSISANVLVNNSVVGGTNLNDDVYNGLENFCLGAPQQTVIQNCQIMCGSPTNFHGNGIAYLGLPTSALLVEGSTIRNCQFGVLFSEFGYNVIVRNNAFSNNVNATITSILGMYPTYAQYEGFAHFLIATNTFDNSGDVFVNQFYGNGFTLNDVVFRGNTVTHGNMLGGAYDGPLTPPYTGFIVDGNTLGTGGGDMDCEETPRSQCIVNFASWMNTVRYNTLNTSNSKYWLNCNGVTNTPMIPACDITVLNDNGGAATVNVAVAAAALPGYPVGFATTIINGPANRSWIVKADPSWNTFASDQLVGSTGVTIRMNAQGKFDLGSGGGGTNYTITANAGANGTIAPSGAVSVPSGSNQTFTIAGNSGYVVTNVFVDGSAVGASNSYTFVNVTATHTISALFGAVGGPTGFNPWTNRMIVTFSGYSRPETLTNFPALVVLGANISGFSYNQFASANGYDLRFSAADGVTELNYEVEKWATSTNSCVWVQVPQLSAGSYIWAYWGNAVWHMVQTNTLDSTANATNNGIAVTTAGSVGSATGIAGGALQVANGGHVTIPGNSPYTDFTNSTATYSAWINFNSLPGSGNEQVIMRKEQNREMGFSDSTHIRSMLKTTGTSGWTANNDDVVNPVVGQWSYVAFTYDGSVIRNFWNGAPLNAGHAVTGPIVGSPYTTSLGAYNGNGDAGPVSLGLNAIIDEIRIEQVVRSTNWIWASYITVASNASFSVYGSVQAGGSGGSTSSIPTSVWIQQYFPGTPTNNYAGLAASNAVNGMTVWQDYLAGMNPTNPKSCFSVGITNSAGQIIVNVPSVQTTTNYPNGVARYYDIERCTNLLTGAPWLPAPGCTGVVANGGIIACTNATQNYATFYRARAWLQ